MFLSIPTSLLKLSIYFLFSDTVRNLNNAEHDNLPDDGEDTVMRNLRR